MLDVQKQRRVPKTITEEEKTWMITSTEIQLVLLESSNHREADTRIILYAVKSRNPVIVRATDTDILVLLTFSWSICKPDTEWLMNIDHKRYASIKSICSRIGNAACQIAITGCDTTSYPFGIEKIKPFKQIEKLRKYHSLSQLGSSLCSVENLSNAKLFFRTCMYSGIEKDEYVTTRIKMYERQKIKSSSTLIQDESSADQHLKRSDLQALRLIPMSGAKHWLPSYILETVDGNLLQMASIQQGLHALNFQNVSQSKDLQRVVTAREQVGFFAVSWTV